jgi:hypothetical protein
MSAQGRHHPAQDGHAPATQAPLSAVALRLALLKTDICPAQEEQT